MAEYRPTDLIGHAAPPFPPHSPDPEHESKLSRRSSISRAENAIKEIFFGNAKVKKHAIDNHVHAIQQQDEDFHDRVITPQDIPDTKQALTDSHQRSPSIEAREVDTTNQNGFSDGTEYGWPGLRSLPSVREQSERKQQTSLPQARREKRMAAAMNEAIDEGADESYGWAGLGSWPSSQRS